MPGFDEQEEESDNEILQIDKIEPSHVKSPARASTSTSAPLRSNKPISAKAAEKKRSTAATTVSHMVCPVCGKSLQTDDNRELNAHIDFCLSRGAIEEAKDLGRPKETKAKVQSQADAWSWFLDPKNKPRSKSKGR